MPIAARRQKPIGRARRACAGWILAVLATWAPAARADTVASLLGNFTINQYCGLALTDTSVEIHYVVVFGQLPALRELHRADADGDGVTTQAERDAYVRGMAPELARDLELLVDGTRLALQPTRSSSSLPTEQGGFSLRLDTEFSAQLPAAYTRGAHRVRFTNRNFDGRFGWREIVVRTSPAVQFFDTDAFSTSLTAALTEALKTLPVGGPLDERSVHGMFIRGAAPAGEAVLRPRPDALRAQTDAAATSPMNGGADWLQRQTRQLVNLISAPHVDAQVTLFALLAAFVLGALHAFSPGHGKTIVGAYLIGSRGTPRHAAFLGFTVTATHTVGVFGLGFATLFASRFIVPEKLVPILSLLSGLIVLAMGMILLAQRWRGANALRAHEHADEHAHDHAHDQHHDHEHHHDERIEVLVHSHGGSLHSHMPLVSNGSTVSLRGLLALGISGGLVPCPSAMVLLLAAVALNKTAYGMLLVVAFSLGLAATLTAVGLAFLYARNRFGGPRLAAGWPRLLPVLSAAVIMVVGMVLCFAALQGARY